MKILRYLFFLFFLFISCGDEETPTGPIANFGYTIDNLIVSFSDSSTVGDAAINRWVWDFGDGSNSAEQHPTHIYTEPGFYDVSLSIKDHTGALLTETQIDLMRIFSEYLPGDLNFDGQNSVSDIVILVNIIIGELSPSEAQNETANVNGDAYINVQDLVSLINLILYN